MSTIDFDKRLLLQDFLLSKVEGIQVEILKINLILFIPNIQIFNSKRSLIENLDQKKKRKSPHSIRFQNVKM